MTDTRIESWLAERKRIHAAATEESDGKEWLAARYTLVAGDDPEDPDEIIGDIRRTQYAAAIVDAHTHLPAFFAAVESVLERHQREMDPFGITRCESCHSHTGEQEEYPCEELRDIEEAVRRG